LKLMKITEIRLLQLHGRLGFPGEFRLGLPSAVPRGLMSAEHLTSIRPDVQRILGHLLRRRTQGQARGCPSQYLPVAAPIEAETTCAS
jgi:hypothetical protein